METLYKDLNNYIDRLKADYGMAISLHRLNQSYYYSKLVNHLTHNNPYCTFIKSSSSAHRDCIRCQALLQKSLQHNLVHQGICPKGVAEYTYPVALNGEFLALISVSGYQAPQAAKQVYLERTHNKYLIDKTALESAYASLTPELPPYTYIEPLLMPLVRLLQLIHLQKPVIIPTDKSQTAAVKVYNLMIQFIADNLSSNITMSNISTAINYSTSYLFAIFSQKNQLTLSHYINHLRIERAKALLLNTDMSISDIAEALGYNNASYFSNTFKSLTNCSPRHFRQSK